LFLNFGECDLSFLDLKPFFFFANLAFGLFILGTILVLVKSSLMFSSPYSSMIASTFLYFFKGDSSSELDDSLSSSIIVTLNY